MLEYIAQEGAFRQNVLDNLSPAAARWAEERLETLLREHNLSQYPSVINLARLVLALGAQGEVVLIGPWLRLHLAVRFHPSRAAGSAIAQIALPT